MRCARVHAGEDPCVYWMLDIHVQVPDGHPTRPNKSELLCRFGFALDALELGVSAAAGLGRVQDKLAEPGLGAPYLI